MCVGGGAAGKGEGKGGGGGGCNCAGACPHMLTRHLCVSSVPAPRPPIRPPVHAPPPDDPPQGCALLGFLSYKGSLVLKVIEENTFKVGLGHV